MWMGQKKSPQSCQPGFMSTYRSPSINGMTVVIVAGWFTLNLLAFTVFGSSDNASAPPTAKTSPENAILTINNGRSWMSGATFGLLASVSWLATSLANSFARLAVRILAAIPCLLLLPWFSTPDLLRHAVSISGLILVQPFVFFLFGIPDWTGLLGGTLVGFRLKQETETSQQPEVAQLHRRIIALKQWSLCCSLQRCVTLPQSTASFTGRSSQWVMLHTITALMIRVVMFHEFIVLAFLSLAMTSTITGLGFAEHFTSQSSTDVGVYFQLYGLFIGAFAFSIAVLSAANASEIKPTAKTREG